MGSDGNLKCASHRQRVPDGNLAAKAQNVSDQRAHQRVEPKRANIFPAAQDQEEEKKAAQPQQRRTDIQAAEPQI